MRISGITYESLVDGPGIRVVIFVQGCDLGCPQCHNPESHPRGGGREYTVREVIRLMKKSGPGRRMVKGVTFSGGEPLAQSEFLINVMQRVKNKLHILLQTSGYAPFTVFGTAVDLADEVYFDLKLIDPQIHRNYTGKDNFLILENLLRLDRSGQKYRIRVPLIPGVTDTPKNYESIRDFIADRLSGNCGGLDLLPYNPAAGGKYQGMGRTFEPGFDETVKPRVEPDFFKTVVKDVKSL